jgi:ribonuclease HepT-like protein
VIPRYQVYRERILSDLVDIRRAAGKAQSAFEAASRGGPDETFYLDATALNLHGFYNGVERLFERLARDLDGTLPTGPAWHRELLAQMGLEIPQVRPAVIRPATRTALEEYLRFRHLVRNLYTWDLTPDKLADLVTHLPGALRDLETDLERFREFLDAARRADESPAQ